jgi:hypothetical protein
MTRAQDRTAARREGRKRRAELRLFDACWRYAAGFDRNTRAPLLASAAAAERPEVPSVVELLAGLEAAALHFAEAVPRPRWRRRRGGSRAAGPK